jgi:Predicted transcriptional regulator
MGDEDKMEKENKGVKNYSMSDAESEVMEKLWEQTESIKQSTLLALFTEDGKAWKRQTLNTFLERLEKKGLVERENRMVKAAYSKEEYHLMQMKESIDSMYGGKLSNFVAAFAKKNAIDKKEAEALMNILDHF